MSVDDGEVVDAIGLEHEIGAVILTIVDHRAWSDNEQEHLQLVENKLNTYLRFIESGELIDTYADAAGKDVLIDLICKYPPNERAKIFLTRATHMLQDAGIGMRCRVLGAT